MAGGEVTRAQFALDLELAWDCSLQAFIFPPAGGLQAPAGSPVGLERTPCTLLASGSTLGCDSAEGRPQPVPYVRPHPQEVTLPPRLLPLSYPSWETCPVESSCPKSASTKQKGQGWLDTWEAQRPETSL